MEHECKHEVDLALMQQSIEGIEKNLSKITHVLAGNGREGLVVRVDRVEEKCKTQPSPRALVFLASIGGGITSTIVWLAKGLF